MTDWLSLLPYILGLVVAFLVGFNLAMWWSNRVLRRALAHARGEDLV